MKKVDVLHQIKSFDKLVLRYFIQNTKNQLDIFPNAPTPTQIQIIDYLVEHHDEEIYQRDLERVFNMRRATVSGVLKTMEKNSFIERVVPTSDARIKRIVLKESAKEVFDNTKKRLDKIGGVVCEGISDQDLETFCKVLDVMQKNLENSLEQVAFKRKE